MQRRPRSLTARSSPQHPAPPSQTATAAENQTRLSPRPQLRGSPSHQVRCSTQQAAVKRRGSPPAQPRTACSLCPAGTKHLVRPESPDRKPRTRAQSRAACLPCTHGPMEGLGGRARNKTQGGVRLSWAFSVMRTFCSVLFYWEDASRREPGWQHKSRRQPDLDLPVPPLPGRAHEDAAQPRFSASPSSH